MGTFHLSVEWPRVDSIRIHFNLQFRAPCSSDSHFSSMLCAAPTAHFEFPPEQTLWVSGPKPFHPLSAARLASKSGRYDVLHAHFGPVGNSFRFVKQLWHVPFLVSFHGYDFATVSPESNIYEKLFASADLVTANSHYAGRKLQALGCSGDKIVQLSYGIDVENYRLRARTATIGQPVRILTIGRLVEKKASNTSSARFRRSSSNILTCATM